MLSARLMVDRPYYHGYNPATMYSHRAEYLKLALEYFDEIKPNIREDAPILYTYLILEYIRGIRDMAQGRI